ncbi:MAG: alpha-(1-_3)-arabinofuranosyltransferase family protein [Chloroflexota bacterium]
MRRTIKGNYFYLIFYAFLSLSILSPLLLPGAILTLDMRLGPNLNPATNFYGLNPNVQSVIRLPVIGLFWLVGKILPFWLWQKILFIAIFFLAGVGAHRLLLGKGMGAYFAGLIYAVNPFTYVRFLAGQWSFLVGYALLPFAVRAFIHLLSERNLRNVIKVALLTTLVGISYEHCFILLFITFAIIYLSWILVARDRQALLDTAKHLGLAAVMTILLNLYWLIPLLTTKTSVVENIGEMDLLSFAPVSTSNLGVVFDTASMYGFWRSAYVYTKDLLPGWWLLFAFILFLAAYGFVSFRRERETKWQVTAFALLWVVSLTLAVGAASRYTRPLYEWLFRQVPFFNVLRDSQKFVALLILCYAYLGGMGVVRLALDLRGQSKRLGRLIVMSVLVLSLITPAVYSFTIFGFHGGLGVTDYPREWYEVREFLNHDKDDFNVLFLPWHEYMDFSWLPNRDKRLGNPARNFFDKPVIQGDNIEMPGIYTQSINPISHHIEFLLSKKRDIDNLGELLAPLNVKYIMLVNEADYTTYDFLYWQKDLSVVLRRPGLTLLENRYPRARVYAVSNITPIGNLDEYLSLSREQNVMDNLYIWEKRLPRPEQSNEPTVKPVKYEKLSPVEYQTEPFEGKYFVFTVPQFVSADYWRYEGQEPFKNLGFMPAFSNGGGGRLVFSRFYRVQLPSYIISLIALVLITFWWGRGKVLITFRRR